VLIKKIVYGLFMILAIISVTKEALGNKDFPFFTEDSLAEKRGLFDGDDYLEMMIITNIDSLLNDIGDNPSYHHAAIRYKDTDGIWVEIAAEIRVRGNFRKQTRNCDFPPLKLKFEKEDRRNTLFEGTKSIKIVTHCQTNIPEFEQYVLQEYLIYRLYNLLSEFSYKVRLIKVTYLDKNNPAYQVEKFAFIFEEEEEMKERLNGNLLEIESVDPDKVDRDYYLLVAFFEYLIINTDWSLPILHNIELLSLDYFKPPVPVPYDFDWSGFINIPYEVPTVNGLKTREPERIYKGPCVKNRDLKKVARFFQSKRQEIFDLYYNFPYLDSEYKAETFNNIHIFYEILEDKYIFRAVFVEQCLN
jgi:hypothetical protein